MPVSRATVKVSQKGDFKKLHQWLSKIDKNHYRKILEKYGQIGVDALAEATPKLTGKTAASWEYRIEETRGRYSLIWTNTNDNKHVNIAYILQHGHGTRTGGYVKGRDYMNPAIQPVMDQIAEKIWEEVTSI